MKKVLLLSLMALIGLSCNNEENKIQVKMDVDIVTAKLKHVVLFKFKDSSSEQDINTVVEAFGNLQNEIEEIKAYEWGLNNSPEGLNQEFTHAFVLSFDSEEDRDAYLPHPAHKAFGGILGPHLDKVLVVDYLAE